MFPNCKGGDGMVRCSHPGCSWRSIAPSEDAAWTQYAEHLVEEHARAVDAEVPDGMVQIKRDDESEWMTVTFDEARNIHDALHDD